MRLSAKQAGRVLTRRKSQHRVKRLTTRMKVGLILPIQKQQTDKNPFTQESETRWVTDSHARVTAIYQQDVDVISDTEIKAEGFDTREEFLEAWTGGKLCHVLCLEPVERPRFMAPVNRFDSLGRSYVHSASGAISKGETVDEETQNRFSKEGRMKDAERRGEAAEKDIEDFRKRIADLRAEASRKGIDMRSELRVLERRLQEKLRRRAA